MAKVWSFRKYPFPFSLIKAGFVLWRRRIFVQCSPTSGIWSCQPNASPCVVRFLVSFDESPSPHRISRRLFFLAPRFLKVSSLFLGLRVRGVSDGDCTHFPIRSLSYFCFSCTGDIKHRACRVLSLIQELSCFRWKPPPRRNRKVATFFAYSFRAVLPACLEVQSVSFSPALPALCW